MSKDEKCGHGTSCSGTGAGHEGNMDEFLENQLMKERMAKIGAKIIVMSGKGGVGKSTVAVNIALGMAMRGLRVGLLDVDIHGPSVPRLLGIEGSRPESDETGLKPLEYPVNGIVLRVMSIGFLLGDRDAAVIWRGPMKMGAIKQFLRDVAWGDLDCLVIDSPPGTGDEPLSVCQLLEDITGAVIVTTPQKLALDDVRKSITFCRQMRLRVLGVVENMSGFVCPKCGETTDVFTTGGGEIMARDMGVPFLGRIPLDPTVVSAGDTGSPIAMGKADTPTAMAFNLIVEPLMTLDFSNKTKTRNTKSERETTMKKIAIPTAEGKLCMHFGHCEIFTIFEVDGDRITGSSQIVPPAHEPGVIPKWLNQQGTTHIIAGGMGSRAQDFFTQFGIEVVVGAQPGDPREIVESYLAGTLQAGENVCDH